MSTEAASSSTAIEAYARFLADDPVAGPSAAAIKALTENIKSSGATTMMGLREGLREAGEALSKRQDVPMSIASLCELFVRFVTRTALELPDFDACKKLLIERGETLARMPVEARSKIAKLGAAFVDAGGVVLTLGYSRCVVGLLLEAARTKHFSVIVAESHPQGDGHTTAEQLAGAGVPVTMIEDAAVAYAMSRCQMVLCGAEAVLESGGIINKTGALRGHIEPTGQHRDKHAHTHTAQMARCQMPPARTLPSPTPLRPSRWRPPHPT